MRIVVKLGTSTLTAGSKTLNPRRMLELVQQMALARERGHEVAVVSSGAMAAGRARLGYDQSPPELPVKQMLAAVGQTHLMRMWEGAFEPYETQVAQVLLTRADLSDRKRYLNARDALEAILANGIVPIINENDAVATEEIRVGDNDNLSALVSNVVNADLLLMLTDMDGLFSADPRKDPSAKLIEVVPQIDDAVYALAGASRTGLGTGGMTTKLQAAELATRSGIATVIANGARKDVIPDAADGKKVGTWFIAVARSIESRKRWILSERANGTLTVDDGAARALREGKSLLPAGAKYVAGEFDRGEIVTVLSVGGDKVARGIARYNSNDMRRILGKQSSEIEEILGYQHAPMLVHADDLVVM
ncbi:MAG TPA: glutamate 5-kinase [Thermoflexales bacterium]|nr:glutamate 5-kinase [Thermoflexales bacterium]HQZ20819.1 glutamate 5-kinase [Thermoflexales bacterium]HRA01439.1 glutamate 5-kinase [Thermoflexales bacterium]